MFKVQLQQIELINRRDAVLLKNINFEITPHSVFTIVGHNGTGKTTLLNSLTGLLNSTEYTFSSSVYFKGLDLLQLSESELNEIRKNKIKYVLQDAAKSFDHLKSIGYYFERYKEKKKKIEENLEYFQLPSAQKLFKMFPYEVSGGMAQRISFVLALLADPDLLILDEPTSSIDHAVQNLFLIKIKEFIEAEERAVLLISQDIKFIEKVSTKVAILSDKTLSEFYKPEIAIKKFLDLTLK